MADRKGEGIALLSVYADEDEEDVDGHEGITDAVSTGSEVGASAEAGLQESSPGGGAAPVPRLAGARGGRFEIVDYGHDDAAMSPEPEGQEQASAFDEPENSHQPVCASDQALEQIQPSSEGEMNADADTSAPQEAAVAVGEENPVAEVRLAEIAANEAQLLAFEVFDDFLPPPTQEKCSPELQTKFRRYLALKNSGRSFNEELRNSKGYRNPDFLQRAVRYQEIDQIGTCFNKEVFDPHGYDPCDYYDAIYEEQKKEMARKQSRRVEQVRGTNVSMATAGIADARPNAPLQLITGQKGFIAFPSGGGQASILGRRGGSVHLPVNHGSVVNKEAPLRHEGRNKRSKWDKV